MQIKTTMPELLSLINQQIASAGEESFFTVDENACWYSHCGKQYGYISNLKWICPLTQRSHWE